MGGDHGHGHGGQPYKIPDYKIYKVENIPQLMATKRALESQGLRDPWLRNEVWKYESPHLTRPFLKLFTRGMGWGLLAAVITTAIGYAIPDKHYGLPEGSEHDHSHAKH